MTAQPITAMTAGELAAAWAATVDLGRRAGNVDPVYRRLLAIDAERRARGLAKFAR